MRAVAAAGLLLTGCFYVDPIITRPVVAIKVEPLAIARGDMVKLSANFEDMAATVGTFDWQVFACEEYRSDGAQRCDPEPFHSFHSETGNTTEFPVMVMTKAHAAPTAAIQVRLEARSDRGAVARSGGNSEFPVGDALPTLEPGMSARTLTVGAPIDLFARYGDADDKLDDVVLAWTPVPPVTPGAFTVAELPASSQPGDPAHRTAGIRLVPGEPGSWDVKVTATDPTQRDPRVPGRAAPIEKHLVFSVKPDQPPCLAQWQPIAPPAGATLPVSAPAVFQVPLVDDDLDAYPPVLGVPEFGQAAFEWSILPPGASQRQVLVGATGNRIDFDPAAFTAGDIVELRVEVFDRHHAALPCGDAAATCSITGAAGCTQRQTWRVEVR